MKRSFKLPDFYSHYYELTHSVKTYDVYTIVNQSPQSINLLTEELRIEDYRGFSDATGFNKYLCLRTTTNWRTCEKVTGLRFTKKDNVFYGDRVYKGKKNLLVFVYSDSQLRIDVYRSYYPYNSTMLQRIIEQY
ncbi:hypothetical protein HX052_17810 [Myroides marinus]|uniref:hypothetical protein n=1 Tax=Myroides marinus TaxID=703342 RepID=UPI0007419B69|nr:hypothetical protein [Myroides marinus]KUF45255.1 hypothetical protein AS361_06335 [Myroides marinus]MDM1391791.1 hypothetical protein [Myroides marinus]